MRQLDHWAIDKFIEYTNNPRKNDHAVDAVAAAIDEFGFRVPIVAQSNGIVVDGHLRLKAARKLGLKELPVLLADDMTEAQIKAFRLSVNKVAELAEWDMELVSLELESLQELDFDIDLTGFDESFAIGNAEEVGLPDLADGDKEPFQQKTFTLHDEQAVVVDDAVMLARTNPAADTGINENSNGNALGLICSQWLEMVNG